MVIPVPLPLVVVPTPEEASGTTTTSERLAVKLVVAPEDTATDGASSVPIPSDFTEKMKGE